MGDFLEAIAAADFIEPALADFLLVSGFCFLEFFGVEHDHDIVERAFFKVVNGFWIDVDAVVAHFKVQMGSERSA